MFKNIRPVATISSECGMMDRKRRDREHFCCSAASQEFRATTAKADQIGKSRNSTRHDDLIDTAKPIEIPAAKLLVKLGYRTQSSIIDVAQITAVQDATSNEIKGP